ncbi:hypothetical protein L9G15_21990, partial [Shewanella sp. A3A]|nr:hypothetical protein [Shewanella ferrihydritica]
EPNNSLSPHLTAAFHYTTTTTELPLLIQLTRRRKKEEHRYFGNKQEIGTEMALRLWASSAANALKISCSGATRAAPAYSISRYFSTVLDGLKYSSSHEW